jgi:CHASE2 domain-containing sensor protein
LLKPFDEESIDRATETSVGLFVPDFSVARHLQEQTSGAMVSGNDVGLALSPMLTSLQGKVVLLGNITWETTPDKYPIPPWNKEVPGVYSHACAAYSLIRGPLLGITLWARLGLDLLVAVVVFVCLSWWHHYYYSGMAEDAVVTHRVHFGVTALAAITVLAVGYGLVQYARILWTDFLLISVALVFQSLLAGQVEKGTQWVRTARPLVSPGRLVGPGREHHDGRV